MDESVTICIVAGPYIATDDKEDNCPVCQQTMVPGNRALTIDEGYGPVTVCYICGLDHIDDLLGRSGPLQS